MTTAARGMADVGVRIELEYLGNLRNPKDFLGARRRVAEVSRRFDIVHAQYGSACAVATASASVPALVSLRGSDWNVHRSSFDMAWMHTRVARAMTRAALGSYVTMTCVSRRMCAEVAACVPAGSRVVYHPSPIDLSLWPERRAPRPDSRRRYRVLFTAAEPSSSIKRLWLLQRAVEIARSRVGEIEIVQANRVPHADMPKLVQTCDVVACTSDAEGWPNSVKEALACGIPFVSTDVGDLRKIAEQDPACRVVDATPAAFAEGLCEVLAQSFRPGLRRHVEHMDLPTSSLALKKLYEQALNR